MRSKTSERAGFTPDRSNGIEGSRRARPAGPGCGLEDRRQYRNVPYIGVLKPEVYSG